MHRRFGALLKLTKTGVSKKIDPEFIGYLLQIIHGGAGLAGLVSID
jgi:hypothetical protein